MGSQDIWWSYWYFHLPNYFLSLVFYCLFGRFILGFFLPPDSTNYIYRSFRWLTEWIYRPVAFITPSALPGVLIAPVAAFWVVAIRVVLFMVLYQFGLTPRPQPAG
ncbi:MAG: YggT family protein [Reyranella sp.]|uniref:YggT family protein n=1 Tax=Reyranella sp. TaxID=1929291 RepID=UPI003D14F979